MQVLRESYLAELETRALHDASVESSSRYSSEAAPVGHQDVKLLQLTLNQLMGREVVKPDGVRGPRTERALRDFQTLFGLPARGDVGEQLETVIGVLRAERPARPDANQQQQAPADGTSNGKAKAWEGARKGSRDAPDPADAGTRARAAEAGPNAP